MLFYNKRAFLSIKKGAKKGRFLTSLPEKFAVDGGDALFVIGVRHPHDDIELARPLIDHLNIDIALCQSGK